jgi:hypothetical protein
MTLSLTVVYDTKYSGSTVQNAVEAALVDPDAGLLGGNVVGIGQVFYDSQIYAACLAVPGVVAVHSLDFVVTSNRFSPIYTKYRGSDLARLVNLQLSVTSQPKAQIIFKPASTCCGERHDPGANAYLYLPADQNLSITLEAAS